MGRTAEAGGLEKPLSLLTRCGVNKEQLRLCVCRKRALSSPGSAGAVPRGVLGSGRSPGALQAHGAAGEKGRARGSLRLPRPAPFSHPCVGGPGQGGQAYPTDLGGARILGCGVRTQLPQLPLYRPSQDATACPVLARCWPAVWGTGRPKSSH